MRMQCSKISETIVAQHFMRAFLQVQLLRILRDCIRVSIAALTPLGIKNIRDLSSCCIMCFELDSHADWLAMDKSQ